MDREERSKYILKLERRNASIKSERQKKKLEQLKFESNILHISRQAQMDGYRVTAQVFSNLSKIKENISAERKDFTLTA